MDIMFSLPVEPMTVSRLMELRHRMRGASAEEVETIEKAIEAVVDAFLKAVEEDEKREQEEWDERKKATCVDSYDDPPDYPFLYHDPPTVSRYFQVRRRIDDDCFLNQIDQAQVPWRKQHNYRMTNNVKDEIAMMLSSERSLGYFWKSFKDMAKQSCDDKSNFFEIAIRRAATFVYSLESEEELYKRSRSKTLRLQEKEFCNKFFSDTQGFLSIPALCKHFVHGEIDQKKYSFLSEDVISDIFTSYAYSIEHSGSFHLLHHGDYPFIADKTDLIYHDIKEVVRKMKFPQRPQEPTDEYTRIDEYTRLLVEIAKGGVVELFRTVVNETRHEFMEIVDTETHLDRELASELISDLDAFFMILYNLVSRRIENKLSAAFRPFMLLAKDFAVSVEVCQIIEVAELRRIALGSRFISRNHLIWAFYECGHVLPPKSRKKMMMNIADEDHLPYQIYLATINLVESLGVFNIELQHFIFGVLYAKDVAIDGVQMIEVLELFKDFLKDAALDCLKRPNDKSLSWLSTFDSIADEEFRQSILKATSSGVENMGRLDMLVHQYAQLSLQSQLYPPS